MELKCLNKKCIKANDNIPYTWDYKGSNPFYASCPRCRSNIKIKDKSSVDKK